jgi:hypothetical protein
MIIKNNGSVWSMCCHWWHICYCSLLAILRKKVGEPKEEIRNLYGFHMNSSIDEFKCTHSYIYEFMYYMNSYNTNIFPPLSIKVISMGMTLFPSMARLALP